MNKRLSQGKILQTARAVSRVITTVHDARTRYASCRDLRPGRLNGLACYLKALAALPHNSDYTPFEAMLKRRLIKARHRVFGVPGSDDTKEHSLATRLPVQVTQSLDDFDTASLRMLRLLADVAPAQGPLLTVQQIRRAGFTVPCNKPLCHKPK